MLATRLLQLAPNCRPIPGTYLQIRCRLEPHAAWFRTPRPVPGRHAATLPSVATRAAGPAPKSGVKPSGYARKIDVGVKRPGAVGAANAGVKAAPAARVDPGIKSPATARADAGGKPPRPSSTETGLQLPYWLLVYHAGRPQLALTGAAKIFAFAFFGFSAAVIAPAFYNIGVAASSSSPYLRYLLPAAIIGAAVLPLYITAFTKHAVVTYIHIALPPAARRSRTALEQWSRRIPATTRVIVTSQRPTLNARQTETCVAELKVLRPGEETRSWWGKVQRPKHGPELSLRRDEPVLSTQTAVEDSMSTALRSTGTMPAGPATSAPHGFVAVPPSRRTDLLIRMTRQRLPGWQPPASARRTSWFTREPTTFVARTPRNDTKEALVWDRFVERVRG